jgi:hypothetical protein
MTKIPGTALETLDLPDDPPGDDDPCWCRSGERFIACHKDRQSQVPESKWALLRQYYKLHESAYCSHPMASPQECRGRIVRAHTLQRAGLLEVISVNRHVYGFDFNGMPDDDGVYRFKLIGINKASTFTGFCQRHDTELFSPLETRPFTASKEQLFLLAYRALSKELYAKRFAIRLEPLHRKGDVGKGPLEQVALQRWLYVQAQLHRLSVRDQEATLKDYEQIFLSRDFDRISAYLIFSDRTPEFAVSGAIYPEYDFTGRKLQDLATPERLDSLTFSALPFRTGGVIAFAWDSTRGTSCHQFLRSLDAFAPADVPDALVRLTGQFENTFLDPRWWEGLSDSVRERLQQRCKHAADPEKKIDPDFLADDGLRTARWKVISREWL